MSNAPVFVLDDIPPACRCHQDAQDGRFTIQTTSGPVYPCPACGETPMAFTLAIGDRRLTRGER